MKYFRAQAIYFSNSSAGFSLIEMLVVGGIIALLSTTIIINFSRNQVDLSQGASIVKAGVRLAQAKSVASAAFNGYTPCGYGIHWVDATQIAIYVGPNAATTDCAAMDKRYQAGRDSILSYQIFTDKHVEFKNTFSDILFLPPDPKTYINNDATLSNAPAEIQIGTVGAGCPANCKSIYVYPSGNIESN